MVTAKEFKILFVSLIFFLSTSELWLYEWFFSFIVLHKIVFSIKVKEINWYEYKYCNNLYKIAINW